MRMTKPLVYNCTTNRFMTFTSELQDSQMVYATTIQN